MMKCSLQSVLTLTKIHSKIHRIADNIAEYTIIKIKKENGRGTDIISLEIEHY